MALEQTEKTDPKGRSSISISKGWVQAVALVFVFGFLVMGILAYRTYSDGMPQPERVVTEDGQVFNRQMDFAEEVSPDELARVQRFLAEVMGGKSLQEIEDGLGEGMAEAFRDPLVRMALDEVLSCLQESELSRAHRLGVSSLLTKPEFSQSQALLPVMQVLEDDTVMLHILDDAVRQGDGTPSVRIGRENDAAELAGVSVVASRYGRGESAGVVAVIGPTRMDYSKVLRAVRIASAALQDV